MGIKKLPEPGAVYSEIPLASVSSHLVSQYEIAHWSPGVFQWERESQTQRGRRASPQLLDINGTALLLGVSEFPASLSLGLPGSPGLGALVPPGLLSTATLGVGKCWVQVTFFSCVGGCKMSSLCVVPPALASLPIHLSFSTLQSSLGVACIASRVNSYTLQGQAGRGKTTLSCPDQESWRTTVPVLVFPR